MTDTLLPKNDDKEILKDIVSYIKEANSFRKLEANMVNLTFNPEEDAAIHILELFQARDTKMLEQARREARIQQIYDIITPIYRDDELIDYVQNLGGYDLIGILDKLKGESK